MDMLIMDIAFHGIRDLQPSEKAQLERTRFSPNTIVVPSDAPAIQVAAISDLTGASCILATDREGNIEGLVLPLTVKQRICAHRQTHVTTFRESLELLQNDPDEAVRRYRHEWLNLDRPVMVRCRGGHVANTDPCDKHK